MRATLFFCLLFISVSSVNAQTYYSFPDSVARCVNTGYTTGTSFALSYSEFYCMNDEDTMMNSKAYIKIDFDTPMSFNSELHQIDVSALSPGIYFLNVNTGANVYSEKFLVE